MLDPTGYKDTDRKFLQRQRYFKIPLEKLIGKLKFHRDIL